MSIDIASMELAIEKLTADQKFALIDRIWESLSQHPEACESPAWHETLLRERRARIESGETKFSDWEDVKKRLQNPSQ